MNLTKLNKKQKTKNTNEPPRTYRIIKRRYKIRSLHFGLRFQDIYVYLSFKFIIKIMQSPLIYRSRALFITRVALIVAAGQATTTSRVPVDRVARANSYHGQLSQTKKKIIIIKKKCSQKRLSPNADSVLSYIGGDL